MPLNWAEKSNVGEYVKEEEDWQRGPLVFFPSVKKVPSVAKPAANESVEEVLEGESTGGAGAKSEADEGEWCVVRTRATKARKSKIPVCTMPPRPYRPRPYRPRPYRPRPYRPRPYRPRPYRPRPDRPRPYRPRPYRPRPHNPRPYLKGKVKEEIGEEDWQLGPLEFFPSSKKNPSKALPGANESVKHASESVSTNGSSAQAKANAGKLREVGRATKVRKQKAPTNTTPPCSNRHHRSHQGQAKEQKSAFEVKKAGKAAVKENEHAKECTSVPVSQRLSYAQVLAIPKPTWKTSPANGYKKLPAPSAALCQPVAFPSLSTRPDMVVEQRKKEAKALSKAKPTLVKSSAKAEADAGEWKVVSRATKARKPKVPVTPPRPHRPHPSRKWQKSAVGEAKKSAPNSFPSFTGGPQPILLREWVEDALRKQANKKAARQLVQENEPSVESLVTLKPTPKPATTPFPSFVKQQSRTQEPKDETKTTEAMEHEAHLAHHSLRGLKEKLQHSPVAYPAVKLPAELRAVEVEFNSLSSSTSSSEKGRRLACGLVADGEETKSIVPTPPLSTTPSLPSVPLLGSPPADTSQVQPAASEPTQPIPASGSSGGGGEKKEWSPSGKKEKHVSTPATCQTQKEMPKPERRVPVILERAMESRRLPVLRRNKFLVQGSLTFGSFRLLLRERLHLPEDNLHFFINNCIPQAMTTMGALYAEYRGEGEEEREDTLSLHITYEGESTYGGGEGDATSQPEAASPAGSQTKVGDPMATYGMKVRAYSTGRVSHADLQNYVDRVRADLEAAAQERIGRVFNIPGGQETEPILVYCDASIATAEKPNIPRSAGTGVAIYRRKPPGDHDEECTSDADSVGYIGNDNNFPFDYPPICGTNVEDIDSNYCLGELHTQHLGQVLSTIQWMEVKAMENGVAHAFQLQRAEPNTQFFLINDCASVIEKLLGARLAMNLVTPSGSRTATSINSTPVLRSPGGKASPTPSKGTTKTPKQPTRKSDAASDHLWNILVDKVAKIAERLTGGLGIYWCKGHSDVGGHAKPNRKADRAADFGRGSVELRLVDPPSLSSYSPHPHTASQTSEVRAGQDHLQLIPQKDKSTRVYVASTREGRRSGVGVAVYQLKKRNFLDGSPASWELVQSSILIIRHASLTETQNYPLETAALHFAVRVAATIELLAGDLICFKIFVESLSKLQAEMGLNELQLAVEQLEGGVTLYNRPLQESEHEEPHRMAELCAMYATGKARFAGRWTGENPRTATPGQLSLGEHSSDSFQSSGMGSVNDSSLGQFECIDLNAQQQQSTPAKNKSVSSQQPIPPPLPPCTRLGRFIIPLQVYLPSAAERVEEEKSLLADYEFRGPEENFTALAISDSDVFRGIYDRVMLVEDGFGSNRNCGAPLAYGNSPDEITPEDFAEDSIPPSLRRDSVDDISSEHNESIFSPVSNLRKQLNEQEKAISRFGDGRIAQQCVEGSERYCQPVAREWAGSLQAAATSSPHRFTSPTLSDRRDGKSEGVDDEGDNLSPVSNIRQQLTNKMKKQGEKYSRQRH